MNSYAYNCKFCSKPGIVKADPLGLEMFTLEKWLPKIACNRCGAFMDLKFKITQELNRMCRVLQTDSKVKRGDEKIKAKLVILTKRYSQVACDYYRLTNVWEEQFAEMIFDHPGELYTILNTYLQQLAREARKATTASV